MLSTDNILHVAKKENIFTMYYPKKSIGESYKTTLQYNGIEIVFERPSPPYLEYVEFFKPLKIVKSTIKMPLLDKNEMDSVF